MLLRRAAAPETPVADEEVVETDEAVRTRSISWLARCW